MASVGAVAVMIFAVATATRTSSYRGASRAPAALALGTPGPPALAPAQPHPAAPALEEQPRRPAATDLPQISLADALAELERQNLSLAQARARADEAAALASQARAALLPTLAAQGSYVRNSDEAIIALPAPFSVERVIQPLQAWSVSGNVRVPLVVPSAWYDLAAARGGARAAQASADAARRQLRAGFASAAHGAVAAEEVVLASERALASAEELARSAERRVAAGTAPPLDALRARTEQVRRESDLARARAERDRARLALGILLGRDGPVRVVLPGREGDGPATAIPGRPGVLGPADEGLRAWRGRRGDLVAEALANRPELAVQQAQVDAADAAVRSSWARLAPQLSGSASAFEQDVPFPTGERRGWRATLDLTWPLLDGGLREGRRRQAEAQRAAARAGAEAQRLLVVQEVEDATRDVAVAAERLRLAETQRRLAADAAASARRSFEAGIASSLDVLDAYDRLYQADVGMADARARLAQAEIALERAVGR